MKLDQLMRLEVDRRCDPELLELRLKPEELRISSDMPTAAISDALSLVASKSPNESLEDIVQAFSVLYRLQYTLGLTDSQMNSVFQSAKSNLLSVPNSSKPVKQVRLIRQGEQIDIDLMWPFNAGTRVKQALGVLVYFDDGTTPEKPRVIAQ